MEEFQLLEEYSEKLEDEIDRKAIKESMREVREAIPLEQVIRELALDDLSRRDRKTRKAPTRNATPARAGAHRGQNSPAQRRSSAG